MTISSTPRTAGPFVGNGVTVSFPFSYKVFSRADVLVGRTVTATGVESILVLDSDYTVTLNGDQKSSPGGIINLAAPLAVGTTLAATSNIPIQQTLDLTNNGGFYPAVINDALDRIVITIQQLAARVGAGALNVGTAANIAGILNSLATLAASGGAALVGYGTGSVADGLNALKKSAAFAFNNATQFDAYGDSITYGVAGTSEQSKGYAFQLAAARGWAVNNNAVNGSMVADQTTFVYAKAVAEGTQSTLMLGTNDFRIFKNDVAKKDRYREGHQALLAWLAIPDDRKILAQRPNVFKLVYTGTWLASPYWGGGLGKRSSVVGSTVSAFVYGTAVYVGVTISEGDNTTFDVSVDGVSYGTFADTFVAGDLATQNGRTYMPKLIRIDGLSEAEHEVKLTVLSSAAGNLFFDWAAGNLGHVTKDGPNLWVGNIPKLSNIGYATLGGTDNSTVAAYNAIIRNNVDELASDGLNVALVDSCSRLNNIIHLDPDGIHPNDAGHQAILSAFTEAINQVAKPRGRGAIPAVSKFNSVLVGNKTLQSTGTPKTLSLGGTYSNVPGANLKLKLLEASAGIEYGIGVSANSIDYRGSATTVHTFYFGDAIKVVLADGVRVKEGANAMQGVATLVAGEIVVANSNIAANSRIFLTSQADGGAPGFVRVRTRVNGTSFTITSSSATDTSTVAYEIFQAL